MATSESELEEILRKACGIFEDQKKTELSDDQKFQTTTMINDPLRELADMVENLRQPAKNQVCIMDVSHFPKNW